MKQNLFQGRTIVWKSLYSVDCLGIGVDLFYKMWSVSTNKHVDWLSVEV